MPGREMILNLIYPFRQNNLSVRRLKCVILPSKTKTSSTSAKEFSILLPFPNSVLSEENVICFSALNTALPSGQMASGKWLPLQLRTNALESPVMNENSLYALLVFFSSPYISMEERKKERKRGKEEV